jgi:hypothetical protein
MGVKCSCRTIVIAAVSCLPAVVTCGSDDGNGGADGASAKGGTAGSTGGGGSSAGTTPGDSSSSGGTAGAGATGATGATGGTGGTDGAGGSGGSGASGGSSGAAGSTGTGGGTSDAAPPPTEAGSSIYAVECRGESRPCGFPAAHCLGIQLDDGGAGFSCSNHCQSVADCSDAPSGAEAQAGCVPFTSESRCVLVCENAGQHAACPTGMTCYTFPGAQIGYCLWM